MLNFFLNLKKKNMQKLFAHCGKDNRNHLIIESFDMKNFILFFNIIERFYEYIFNLFI